MADRLAFRLLLRGNLRRERVFRDHQNPFDMYTDSDFYARFRFRRQDVIHLVNVIGDSIDYPLPRKGSVPPLLQVMVALRYYASGNFQIIVGDLFGIERKTVGRIINRVSRSFSDRLNEYVRLPVPDDAEKTITKFYAMAHFPNVVGCIECTHVNIIAPTENENVFINRKGRHSINCQLVCDADLIIFNCVVNWPGSVHDSRILRESNLFESFEQVPRPLLGILLGDSGYPLKEWLLTPYTDPNTPAKERYNGAHCSTRSTIERTNGVLKKRWHCLQTELRYDPPRACRIILSCIILHNVAVTLRLPVPEPDFELDAADSDSEDENDNYGGNVPVSGRLARDRIAARHFQD